MVNDLSTPDPFDKIANLQRSQGIELDMTGYLSNNFSLIGSYAFTDARVLKDYSGATRGNRLNNVPEHSGSLWLRYDANGYAAKDGFSAGLGGVAAGQREGDNANSFQMPGYVRMDAFLAYKHKIGGSRITAQFNIRNLLDKEYYESTDPDSNVAPALGFIRGAADRRRLDSGGVLIRQRCRGNRHEQIFAGRNGRIRSLGFAGGCQLRRLRRPAAEMAGTGSAGRRQ